MSILDKYENLKERGDKIRRENDELMVLEKQSERQIAMYEEERSKLINESDILNDVIRVSQLIRDDTQSKVEDLLETVLNSALGRVDLDSNYEAKLIHPTTKKAIKGLLVKLIDSETGKERTPFESTGTMVAQLISFLMTAIVLKMSGNRRLLVVDEVLSGFNDVYSIKEFGDVLVALAKNDKFQIVMVEHKSQLEGVEGLNVIHVGKDNEGLKVYDVYTVEEGVAEG